MAVCTKERASVSALKAELLHAEREEAEPTAWSRQTLESVRTQLGRLQDANVADAPEVALLEKELEETVPWIQIYIQIHN